MKVKSNVNLTLELENKQEILALFSILYKSHPFEWVLPFRPMTREEYQSYASRFATAIIEEGVLFTPEEE